jgi:hypothetical protein
VTVFFEASPFRELSRDSPRFFGCGLETLVARVCAKAAFSLLIVLERVLPSFHSIY